MRTFIAISLPEDIRHSLGGLSERLRRSGARATWVKPENIHLTLRFLGDVPREDVEGLMAILERDYAGSSAFDLSVKGVGAFPNVRRPSVVWAGIVPLEGTLAQVQAIAESAAQAIGLPAEKKAFHPHLTISRIKDESQAGRLSPCLASEQDYDGGSFSARNVAIYSSDLTPRGPIYTRLREFPFIWTS